MSGVRVIVRKRVPNGDDGLGWNVDHSHVIIRSGEEERIHCTAIHAEAHRRAKILIDLLNEDRALNTPRGKIEPLTAVNPDGSVVEGTAETPWAEVAKKAELERDILLAGSRLVDEVLRPDSIAPEGAAIARALRVLRLVGEEVTNPSLKFESFSLEGLESVVQARMSIPFVTRDGDVRKTVTGQDTDRPGAIRACLFRYLQELEKRVGIEDSPVDGRD